MVPTLINGRWTLTLPSHRAERPQWQIENGGWEVERLASMHANLRPGDLVIDVGSEEGDFPALWASWGCRVVLVEPNPRVWPNMKAIWDANGLPTPAGCYVGFAGPDDDACPDNMLDGTGWWADGMWPPCADGEVIGDHGFLVLTQRPDVPRVRLDTIGETVGPIDAITIDVEGGEVEVLKGARRVLSEDRPMIWISVHPDFLRDEFSQSPADLFELLMEHGYDLRFLARNHEEHWLAWHPAGRWPV